MLSTNVIATVFLIFCSSSFVCGLHRDFSRKVDEEHYTIHWLRRVQSHPEYLKKEHYPAAFKGSSTLKNWPKEALEAFDFLSYIAHGCHDCLHVHHVLSKITSDNNFSKMIDSARVQALDCARK